MPIHLKGGMGNDSDLNKTLVAPVTHEQSYLSFSATLTLVT